MSEFGSDRKQCPYGNDNTCGNWCKLFTPDGDCAHNTIATALTNIGKTLEYILTALKGLNVKKSW